MLHAEKPRSKLKEHKCNNAGNYSWFLSQLTNFSDCGYNDF